MAIIDVMLKKKTKEKQLSKKERESRERVRITLYTAKLFLVSSAVFLWTKKGGGYNCAIFFLLFSHFVLVVFIF